MPIDEMHVPRPLDLGQHHDVELVADLAHDPRHVVEKPRRIQRVDANPEPRRAKIARTGHRDETFTRVRLRLDRNRILEIAQHDVDLGRQFSGLGANSFVVRRHEMDHALQPRRQFDERTRRADRQRLEKLAWGSHRKILEAKSSSTRHCERSEAIPGSAAARSPI